ncbi:MAG: ThuA domain-containing protein [Sphingomonadaceae bacterium]|uniref:ThuA domain-containing protein n=1 Tax=Thermaurantiacus sp. TaxID=2820283 RepID=UPI00298EE630|nr:ThuA domain-containing protein [Thermaurantiacus sp.]MCS6987150.1 ThuA domain-containing protein [Sphingomonadaceae bacterium]MDW8415816.1 ThuA domain-containing protein [Thermaurantiacus sp.]
MADPVQVHLVAAGKYHDIDFARLELLKLFAEEPRIRASVAMSYADLDRLQRCAALVTYTCDLVPSPEETVAIRAWLERGGRWLALHGTNSILRFLASGLVDSPAERDDVMEILGTQFVAHPPIGPFRVHVEAPDDPLVAGEEDFEVVDELYLSRHLAPITTLLSARFAGEAPGFVVSSWPETRVPILYRRRLGQGEVVYCTLGHCRSHHDVPELLPFWPHPERCAWNYPVFYRLLRRGLRWAIGALD